MELSFTSMEEELTCPVCLELFADPLMLPCSHSICKKCVEEILNCKSQTNDGLECPACRKLLNLDREKILALPKNLALENIVARYTEDYSQNVRRSQSTPEICRAPDESPLQKAACLLNFGAACDLCEPEPSSGSAATALWFCTQCNIAYCSSCRSRFHPLRGALAKHTVHSLAGDSSTLDDDSNTIAHCSDHRSEQASMFCDRCKVYVCHLCVCDGEGRHAGHKMLLPETASTMVKALANKTKEQSDCLLATLLDQQTKLDVFSTEMKEMYGSSCARVEQQYQRFIDDLTTALLAEKQLVLRCLADSWQRVCRQVDGHSHDSERCSRQLSELSVNCQTMSEESTTVGVLSRASELQPLVFHVKRHRRDVGLLRRRFESILKDKSSKLQLLSGTEQFRKRIDKLLSWFLDDGISGNDSIIPHISFASAGNSELASRVPSKYLTTWGFSSTSFTGDSVSHACSWTVTVERSSSSHCTAPLSSVGYLFGVGVSSAVLAPKEIVGKTAASHALVYLNEEGFCFAHDGQQDVVAPPLDTLPVTLTIAVRPETPDVTVFTYKIASVADGRRISLVGRRIVHDSALSTAAYPVFTVSQHVKILFPTYV